MKSRKSTGLIALSTTALALPGIALSDAPPSQSIASYKISNYSEDDIERSESPFGDLERYDIDVHQFKLISPIGRNFSFSLDANHETMSGASPWYTSSDVNGDPIVALSGASGIYDERSEVSFSTSYYLDQGTVSGTAGYSEENDYRAIYYALGGSRNFNNELTTLSFGYSYSSDEIFPTDAKRFNRVKHERKNSKSGVVSVSQIISQNSTYQLSLNISEQSGFLSDPYKLKDVRPSDKTQIAVTNSYRHFFEDSNSALHINYRYYHDDFGISSHVVDSSWHQNFGRSLRVVPSIRYYTQSAANFFTNIDDFAKPESQYQSSDYRLSAFGAVSGGIDFVFNYGRWSTIFSAERYVANDRFAGHTVNKASTALVRFNRFSIGFEYIF